MHTQLWRRSVVNWNCTLLLNLVAVITDYDYVVAHTNGELIGTQVSLWAPQAYCLVSSDGLNLISTNLVARKCY